MLDFPTTLRLREEEEKALRELVRREPLLAKATIATGLVLLGLDQIRRSDSDFQRLLDLLRRRQHPELTEAA